MVAHVDSDSLGSYENDAREVLVAIHREFAGLAQDLSSVAPLLGRQVPKELEDFAQRLDHDLQRFAEQVRYASAGVLGRPLNLRVAPGVAAQVATAWVVSDQEPLAALPKLDTVVVATTRRREVLLTLLDRLLDQLLAADWSGNAKDQAATADRYQLQCARTTVRTYMGRLEHDLRQATAPLLAIEVGTIMGYAASGVVGGAAWASVVELWRRLRRGGQEVERSRSEFIARARWAINQRWNEGLGPLDEPDEEGYGTEPYFCFRRGDWLYRVQFSAPDEGLKWRESRIRVEP